MLVDLVKHYFYIWLIRLRLSHDCGWHCRSVSKNKFTGQERGKGGDLTSFSSPGLAYARHSCWVTPKLGISLHAICCFKKFSLWLTHFFFNSPVQKAASAGVFHSRLMCGRSLLYPVDGVDVFAKLHLFWVTPAFSRTVFMASSDVVRWRKEGQRIVPSPFFA